MCDAQNNFILPENADKVLFAEDFVNHILLRFELPLLPSEIADHREFIHNAFNAQVRLGANCACEKLEKEMAEEFEDVFKSNTIDINVFSNYAIFLRDEILELMLPNAYGMKQLMEFSVKISTLAAKFYKLGFLDAPRRAVDYIISLIEDINMLEQGGWRALDSAAATFSQFFMDTAENYLTPDNSGSNLSQSSVSSDCSSSESSSRTNSEASHSPDHEMDDGDDQDEQPEKLTYGDFYEMCSSEATRSPDHQMDVGDDQDKQSEKITVYELCEMCTAAMSSSSEGPVSSRSICKHVEKTIDVISENIMSISDNTSDSVSSGSPKEKNSETSFHSFEETSSEDDTSKRKIRKIRKKKKKNPSYSYSKDSDSDSNRREADLERTDYIDPFDG